MVGKFIPLLCLASSLVLFSQQVTVAKPAQPLSPALGASSAWTGDSEASARNDNSGRQLAVALPALPSSASAKVPFAQINVAENKKKQRVVTITVPEPMGKAADALSVAAQHISKASAEAALEVCAWFAALFKQMNQSPTLTPLGDPFALAGIASANVQLRYMPDGRLKTIVSR